MSDFAQPPPAPKTITYTSAESGYAAFGWTVTTHRAVREFSTLLDAGPNGFKLLGSGSATVLTPPRFVRHARYRITERSSGSTTSRTARTGRARRLTILVALGPRNTVQEYPADGPATTTKVYATQVSIRRLASTRSRRTGR